jgi:hypothetical protein
MKTNTYRKLILLCLLLVIGVSAHGQSGMAMTTKIPFDFSIRWALSCLVLINPHGLKSVAASTLDL